MRAGGRFAVSDVIPGPRHGCGDPRRRAGMHRLRRRSADPSPEFETVARRGRARRRQALPGRAQPLTPQECLTPPQSPTIQGYRRRTRSRIGEQNHLLIQLFSPMSPSRSWWIAPRRSPAGVWTSDPAWSPKRRRNRPKPTAQRRDTVVFKPPICRRSAALAAESRLPENRGVPGSSPGLAIRRSACSLGRLRSASVVII